MIAQPARTLDYTECISAEGYNSPYEYPVHDTEPFDGEASVMIELLGIRSTPLSPSLPGALCPGVKAPNRFLSIC